MNKQELAIAIERKQEEINSLLSEVTEAQTKIESLTETINDNMVTIKEKQAQQRELMDKAKDLLAQTN